MISTMRPRGLVAALAESPADAVAASHEQTIDDLESKGLPVASEQGASR